MGSKVKDAEGAVRLLQKYTNRLKSQNEECHLTELEYLKHILDSPAFQSQLKEQPSHFGEDREVVKRLSEGMGVNGISPPGNQTRGSTWRNSRSHSPADRRFSSGSESSSVGGNNTWRRVKRRNEKQASTLPGESLIVEDNEEVVEQQQQQQQQHHRLHASLQRRSLEPERRREGFSPKSGTAVRSSGEAKKSQFSRKAKSEPNILDSVDSDQQATLPGTPAAGQRGMWSPTARGIPTTRGVPTHYESVNAESEKEIIMVSLHKPKSGSLGFSVVGLKSDNRGDLGTFIREIQPDSLADRDGRLHCDDEILSINGRSLSGMSQERAISLLRSVKGRVDLVVARVKDKTSPKVLVPSKANKAQRRYNIETIELHGRGKSYGFGIIDSKLGGVEVYDIQEGSVAERNGRLRAGDRLLQINDQNAEHMTCYEAARQLQASKGSVRLVIARVASDTQEEDLPYFSVSYHHRDVYDVELKKDSSGLGITIAGVEQQGLQGIVVTSITPKGPADCSGKIATGDQVLTVDGRSLLGMENKAAAAIIRNSGERVKLTLGRTKPPPDLHKPREATDGHDNLSPAERSSDAIKSYWKNRLNNESLEVKIVTVEKSPTDGGLGIRLDGIQEHDKQGAPVGSIHHVVQTVKPGGPIGRQKALEVQDELLEVDGVSLMDMSHDEAVHVIKNAPQRVQIVAVPYMYASDSPSPNTLREMISAGPPVYHSQDDTTSVEGHPTSESEDDKQKTNSSSSWREQLDKLQTNEEWKPALERIRAERESLRQKYELEKEKLRLKIEQNKKEYEHELAEQEMMLKEHERNVQIWKKEMEKEEEEERIKREKRREEMAAREKASELPPWPKFLEEMRRGANVTMPPYPSMSSPEVFTGTDVDDKGSVSSHEGDNPLEITGEWSDDIEMIELQKGPEGLGFSLMHYKLLGHEIESTVVLVCDLIHGSVAQQDGRLKKADQLVCIGNVDVLGQPVSYVVDMLKATQSGPVVLRIRHALHCSLLEEEEDTFGRSLSSSTSRLFDGLTTESSTHVSTTYIADDRTLPPVSPSAGSFQPSPQSAFQPVIKPIAQAAVAVPPFSDSSHQHTWSLSEPAPISGVSPPPNAPDVKTGPLTGVTSMNDSNGQSKDGGGQSSGHQLLQTKKKAVSRSVADILLDGMDEAEPRTCHIHVGNREVGLSLASDEVRGVIVVKYISKGGAVERDGRIREGDRIVAINGRKLEGITVQKARALLKKAAGRHPKEISLQYIPCPQGYVPKVTAVMSETPSASEPETPLQGNQPLQSNAQVGHAFLEDRSIVVSRGQGDEGVDVSHAARQRPKLSRTDRISSTSTVIEHATTTDEDTSGSRENMAFRDSGKGTSVAYQMMDLIHDPSTKNMMMASAGEGPTQRAARALKNEKKKFPIPDTPASQEGSRDESGDTPDGLSPDNEFNPVPMTSKMSPHQYSRSTDAVKLRPERSRRKGGYSRHSCDAIHMIESSSSESEGELHLQQRRSGPRRKNGGGGSAGTPGSSRHLLQQYPHLTSQDHRRQSSQPHESTSSAHTGPPDGDVRGLHLKEGSGGKLPQIRQVQLFRDSSGSLGIGIVGGEQTADSKGKLTGIFVSSISTAVVEHVMGSLKPGDQILGVNGRDLTCCSHHEAVQTIKTAASPVVLMVRCRSESSRPGRKSSLAQPQHQQHNSWAIDEDEDASLRSEFPNADGHLYKVSLERGHQGLGMSIYSNKSGRGVMVTSVVANGVADETGKIKEGDEIVKVNNIVTLGMTEMEVGRILREAPPTINLIILRPSAHIPKPPAPQGHDSSAVSGKGAKPFRIAYIPKDNQFGFGITLEKLRLPTGEAIIAVKSIDPGGPAEREGQLSVGDQIVSIDGESVVGPGMSVQQVHYLLTQAQMKGSTTLIAADASSPSSCTRQEGSAGGSVGEKRKTHTARGSSTPLEYDTHVLPRKRRLSPKKRANSSKEADPGVTSGLHQARQASTDLHQQQPPEWVLQPGQPIVPGEKCVLEIHKQHNGLGLRIVGGVETHLKNIYIQDILQGTAAYLDGRLRPGDQIISVGSVSLLSVRHEQAKQALREAMSPVRLTVMRDLARSPRISFSDDPTSVNMDVETVELTKINRAGLGLSIVERENEAGVFVDQVFPHSPAFKDGRIRAGDKILAVNGHDVSTAKQDVVVLTLQGCKETVKLTVSHPVCVTPGEKEEPMRRQPLQIPPVPVVNQPAQPVPSPIAPFQPSPGRRGEPYYSNASTPRPHLPQYPASYLPPVYPQGARPNEDIQAFTPPGVPPPYQPTTPEYYQQFPSSPRQTSASRLVQQTSFPPPSYVNRHHSMSNVQTRRPAPTVQPPQSYPSPPRHGYHGEARSPGSGRQPQSRPQQGYPHAPGYQRYMGGVSDGKEPAYPSSRPSEPAYPSSHPSEPAYPSSHPSEPAYPSSRPSDPTYPSSRPSEPAYPSSRPSEPAYPSSRPSEPAYPSSRPSEPAYPSSRPSEPAYPSSRPSEPAYPSSHPSEPTYPSSCPSEPAYPSSRPSEPAYPSSRPSEPAYPSSRPSEPAYPSSRPSEPAYPSSRPSEPAYPSSRPSEPAYPSSRPSEPAYPSSRPSGGSRHVKVVRLRKGKSGLGFIIAGGVGSPLGNLPIIVKEVLVDGAAWKEGQLWRGDEILSVNGVNFQGITQEYALNALSSIQGDIEMHVLSS